VQAVILIGIQGAGKTSFYKERFFNTHVRISLDLLATRHREKMLLDCCIASKTRFVVDNTNPTRLDRARYIEPARQARYEIVGYYFSPDLQAALRRNSGRPPRELIPAAGIVRTYRRIEPPGFAEGFDALYTVTLSEGGFRAEPWIRDVC
jgi:predicted kinase